MALDFTPLSVGERDVVKGIYLGKRPKDIAIERGTSHKTIHAQLLRVAEKMGFESVAQLKAALIAQRTEANTCRHCGGSLL